ncbi:MAG TPA: Fic/DOC family N-terminal domain-containing protein, partial [Opitutaceae bacterium]|nr:Fic/DOC family N-terminal domain-containing protein [Opitutaceae bacterium]
MGPKDFKSPDAGQVIRHPTDYHYFVPADLPPKIDFDWESVKLLSRADSALSELSGLGRALPNPQLLLGPMIAKEAVQSSRIEGTQASLTDVLQNEAAATAPEPGMKAADVREVR